MSSSQTTRNPWANPYLIQAATIVEKIREAEDIDTYRLRFVDEQVRRTYRFAAGQFNMVYLFGVGEVAISIVSDPDEPELLDHTIRAVGRVTKSIARLQLGDELGIAGRSGKAGRSTPSNTSSVGQPVWKREDSARGQDAA